MSAEAIPAVEHAAGHLAEAVHHAAEAAGGHLPAAQHAAQAGGIPELPNIISLLSAWRHDQPVIAFLHRWENLAFALLIGAVLCAVAWRFGRRPGMIPAGMQNLLEMLVEGVDAFVRRVIGPAGRAHTPFLGTLFLYIWLMNLAVLVPGLKSSTSSLNTTVALALVVFAYVQWFAIRANGLLGWVDHLAGSPRGVVGWAMVPLMLPIHVLGEVVKPLSLSLRLGFNVFAEDVLLAVLAGLGLAAGAALHAPIPLQVLVVPLVVIFSTVQALVFSLLSAVYIALMVPHGEPHGSSGH